MTGALICLSWYLWLLISFTSFFFAALCFLHSCSPCNAGMARKDFPFREGKKAPSFFRRSLYTREETPLVGYLHHCRYRRCFCSYSEQFQACRMLNGILATMAEPALATAAAAALLFIFSTSLRRLGAFYLRSA